MYLSEKWKGRQTQTSDGTLGEISVGGEQATLVSDGEQVSASVFGPGGMYWVPRRGDQVLVIKADGAEHCIVGVEETAPKDMLPGEIQFKTQGASLWLKNDGSIAITGRVLLNGEELAAGGV